MIVTGHAIIIIIFFFAFSHKQITVYFLEFRRIKELQILRQGVGFLRFV